MNDQVLPVSQPALPKGGGAIKGIGETFQPHEFSGTAALSIPVPTSPSRGFEPRLSIDYSSGAGNGVFGLGWTLSLPNISRKTSKGTPRYDGSDTFILSNAEELVPLVDGRREVTIGDVDYLVQTYRPRSEGLFAKIERWVVKGRTDSYWRVISQENVTSIFGATPQARICHPARPTQVFQWLLQESLDARGNYAVYEYLAESPEEAGGDSNERNHALQNNRLLARIKYGNDPALTPQQWQTFEILKYGTEPALNSEDWENEAQAKGLPEITWHFEVAFDYGDHIVAPDAQSPDKKYEPPAVGSELQPRLDPFSNYHAGFEIRTRRLCRNILLFHRFAELGPEPVLTHATRFHYLESPSLTLLQSVEPVGYRLAYGRYETRKLPPLTFSYTTFDPSGSVFTPFLTDDHHFPPGVESPRYQLVDLYGEGLPGILYGDGQTVLYWEPRGAAGSNGAAQTTAVTYGSAKQPTTFPLHRDFAGSQQRLMDLTGDGHLDLVVTNNGGAGYYQVRPDQTWEGLRALPSVPTNYSDPDGQLIDLTGDGLADLVRIEHNTVQVYPGLGRDGFSAAESRQRPVELPWPSRTRRDEVVRFADMFGSGGNHLVKISSGRVECWPHLGYGEFAAPVLLANAPRLPDSFDPARLFLVDIDSSGTADLIYAHEDRVQIWFNHSGNAFAREALTIPLPAPNTQTGQLSFADVFGTGATALVFSDNRPRPRHWVLDLSQGRKAHLLNKIDNNLGATSQITYASSTKFYLADKRQRKPWLTRLPFPVQVVEKIETEDLISATRLVRSYTYRHGYYDGEEREFRGFGLVERRDAETLSLHSTPTDVPPVLTKSWYHTGAALDGDLARHYRPEYYQGDSEAPKLAACLLEPAFAGATSETLRHAARALHGRILRQEVYSEDEKGVPGTDPYTVSESGFAMRLIQPPTAGHFPILFVHPGQTFAYHYERSQDDPRVEQQVTLDVDPYGHVQRACHLFYPRRDPQQPEQGALKAVATLDSFLQVDTTTAGSESLYLAGVPGQQRSFEIGGLRAAPGKRYLTIQEVREGLDKALQHQITFDDKLDGGTQQVRLLSWQRHYYWNALGSDHAPVLDASHASSWDLHALLHHVEEAALPQTALAAVPGAKIDPALLPAGGYILRPAPDGDSPLEGIEESPPQVAHWWKPGLVRNYYGGDHFFLPAKTVDPFGAKTTITYDAHHLLPVKVTDALGNETKAEIDYQTVQPWRITDINENVSEALYDPLGRVVATAVYGSEEGLARGDKPLPEPRTGFEIVAGSIEKAGSAASAVEPAAPELYAQLTAPAEIADIVADPGQFLQTATSRHFYLYDLAPAPGTRRPACALDLRRELYESDLAADTKSPVQIALEYSDGFGRIVQSKSREEPGPLEVWDDNGRCTTEEAAERWLSSGRTVYNNKGLPVRQYEPFYSPTAVYEEADAGTIRGAGTIHHYDPLGRLVKVETPAGISAADPAQWDYYFSEVQISPWRTRHMDENATITQTDRYQQRAQLDPDQQDALNKAAKNAGAATIIDFDVQGRPFLTHGMLTATEDPGEWLTTHRELDIQGHELSSTDPRFYALNAKNAAEKPDGDPLRNFRHVYDMTGAAIFADSADAGQRWTLHDVLGRPFHHWHERDAHLQVSYDALQRPLEVRLTGADGKAKDQLQIVERLVYGESSGRETAVKNNLRGQLVEHYDQAGVLLNDAYDIAGRLSKSRRQLRRGYKGQAVWNQPPGSTVQEVRFDPRAVSLEENSWASRFTYDALGRLLKEVHPDGSRSTITYHPRGWLKHLAITFSDERVETYLENTTYNARGQRTRLAYGNGVASDYHYDPATYLLTQMLTKRGSDGQILQDLHFAHDPLGNPTRVRDKAQESIFNGTKVDPLSDYTYDALQRLVKAIGREHPALAAAGKGAKDPKHPHQARFLHLNDGRQLQNYLRQYTYDPAGNLVKARHSGADTQNSWSREMTLSPTANRAVPAAWLAGGQAVDSFFDAHGNQLKLENLRAMHWNFHDHLGSVDLIQRAEEDPDAEYYVYDAAGQRVRKVTESKTKGGTQIREKIYLGSVEIKRTTFVNGESAKTTRERVSLLIHDGRRTIAISHRWTKLAQDSWPFRSSGRPSRFRGPSGRLEASSSGAPEPGLEEPLLPQTRYQLDNHVGTTALELNHEGEIISYEEFYPYGGTALIAGKDQTEVQRKEYRYSGKERDDSTGLYYYGARYYAPWIGRWLNPDPAGVVDGLNLYAFVRNNPIRFIDHWGNNGDDKERGFFGRLSSRLVSYISRVKDRISEIKEKHAEEAIKIVGFNPDAPDPENQNWQHNLNRKIGLIAWNFALAIEGERILKQGGYEASSIHAALSEGVGTAVGKAPVPDMIDPSRPVRKIIAGIAFLNAARVWRNEGAEYREGRDLSIRGTERRGAATPEDFMEVATQLIIEVKRNENIKEGIAQFVPFGQKLKLIYEAVRFVAGERTNEDLLTGLLAGIGGSFAEEPEEIRSSGSRRNSLEDTESNEQNVRPGKPLRRHSSIRFFHNTNNND